MAAAGDAQICEEKKAMTAKKRTVEDYTYGSGRDPRSAEIWAARSPRRDLPLDRKPSVHRFPLLSD